MISPLSAAQASIFFDRLLEIHAIPGLSPEAALREVRLLFEQLFRQLTDAEGRLFANTFQRTLYVADQRNLDEAARTDLLHLRRVLFRPGREVGVTTATHFLQATGAFSRLIAALSETAIPESLMALTEGTAVFPEPEAPSVSSDIRPFMRVIIRRVGELKISPRGTAFFLVEVEEESTAQAYTIGFRDFETYAYSKYHAWLKPYRILHCTQLEAAANRPGYFFVTLKSEIVLEPDFLMDVTEVAECFQYSGYDARLFLLSKFSHSEPNVGALKGKLVNDVMDALILSPDADAETVVNKALAGEALRAITIGAKAVAEIRDNILKDYVPVIRAQVKKLSGTTVRVEPSFFSAFYGLQGRLDVLEEFVNDPGLKQVFELKSGKAPQVAVTADGRTLSSMRENVWASHRMQVIAYHMLLRSAFGEHIRGRGAIFYPADPHFPLRVVEGAPQAERELLEVRNAMVFYLLELAEGRHGVLNELIYGRIPAQILPSYKHVEAENLSHFIKTADPVTLAYLKQLVTFVVRELQAAKTGGAAGGDDRSGSGFASLWLDPPDIKEKRFNLLRGLTLQQYDPATATAVFRTSDRTPPHNFREGDIGILYPFEEGTSPLQEQMLRGTIARLNSETVVFAFRSLPGKLPITPTTEWAIEHDLYESSFWGQLQAFYYVLSAPEYRRELLLGRAEPAAGNTNWLPDPNKKLLPNQCDVIRGALSAPDYFLIQGPPGTGKTSTILMEIVSHLVRSEGENIVILAYTNRAVREIARRLQNTGIAYELLSSREAETPADAATADLTLREIATRLKNTRVFLATVTSFQSRASDILKLTQPRTLIVDEASQLVESQLAGLLVRFEKWILIGDQNQLPAVMLQSEAQAEIAEPALNALGFSSLRQSLFERLYQRAQSQGWTHAYAMLTNHFRMHEDIAALINRHYNNRLKSGTTAQQGKLALPQSAHALEALLSRSRTLFVPSEKSETARTHLQEARRIERWLRYFRQHHFREDFFDEDGNARVGVITPFRAQITAIRETIDESFLEGVTIDTVERFQGSERDVILVSLAVNDVRQIPSLQDIDRSGTIDRKLLVAVSRARKHLIIHGFEPALMENPHYQQLLSHIRLQGGLLEHTDALRAAFEE